MRIAPIRARVFDHALPPSTILEVSVLADPDLLVEFDVTAVVD